MFDPSKFTTTKMKPFPVFLLLDTSGSMREVIDPENAHSTGRTVFEDGQEWEIVEGGTSKIQLLNEAVAKMIELFAEEEKMETEFWVSVITFGDDVNIHLPLTKASEIRWNELLPQGNTAMGAALALTKKQVENKEIVPSRAYRPTIVLVSDGKPTDDWETPMRNFINEGRSSKCFCVSMGIGSEADKRVLSKFIENTPYLAQQGENKINNKVFSANDADSIHEFFQKVTMSVTSRSRSINPNQIPLIENSKINDDEGYW